MRGGGLARPPPSLAEILREINPSALTLRNSRRCLQWCDSDAGCCADDRCYPSKTAPLSRQQLRGHCEVVTPFGLEDILGDTAVIPLPLRSHTGVFALQVVVGIVECGGHILAVISGQPRVVPHGSEVVLLPFVVHQRMSGPAYQQLLFGRSGVVFVRVAGPYLGHKSGYFSVLMTHSPCRDDIAVGRVIGPSRQCQQPRNHQS